MPRSVKHGGKKVYKFKNPKNIAKRKKKQQKKKREVKIKVEAVAGAWKKGKTTRENMATIGLSYDANMDVGFIRKETAIGDMEVEEVSIDEVNKLRKKKKPLAKNQKEKKETANVIAMLEKEATEAEEKQKGRKPRLLEKDVEFCVYMMTKHGENYVAMAKDPRNIFQNTPKQLEKKMRVYKTSVYYKALEGMEE